MRNALRAVNWALFEVAGLTPTQSLILVRLAAIVDGKGVCCPSQTWLAKLSGQHRQAVCAHLRALETAGVISSVRKRRRNGMLSVKQYRLIMPD